MGQELELYIHIPFCVRKCNYCDFVSFAGRESLFDSYVDALCEEIRCMSEVYQDRRVTSMYFGGGTPSILREDQITRLVETLKGAFSIPNTKEKRRGLFLQKRVRPDVEVSLECNPGTVDRSKLNCYRKLGINRLSIGLQSTDDQDLRVLGRIHTYEDFVRTYESAREAGFDNLNVDLMQAIPGQTLQSWKRVLALVGTWKPEHISAYSLIVEEGTPFDRMQREGTLQLPDEETERQIYAYTKEFLEAAGYRRYEISNYAVPGYECRHNIGYWKRTDYLGLGLNASSLIGNVRWKNTADIPVYLKAYAPDASSENRDAVREEEATLSRKDQMEEFIFLGLRLSEGISRKSFLDIFHQDFDMLYGESLRRLVSQGLLITDGDQIRLTDRGVDVSNYVFRELL